MGWHDSKQSGNHGGRGRDTGPSSSSKRREGERHQDVAQSPFGWGRAGHEARQGTDTLARMVRSGSNNSVQPSGFVSKFAVVAAIAALVLWSLIAWGTYGLVDALGGWLSANGGALLQGGKDAAGAMGIAKEVIDKVDFQRTTGLLQQLAGAALLVARPTIVFVWFLGAAAILAAPFVLGRLGRFVRSKH